MLAPDFWCAATDTAFCYFFNTTDFDEHRDFITTYEHVPVDRTAGVTCNHVARECLVCPGGQLGDAATIPRGYTVHLSSSCRDVAGDGGGGEFVQLRVADATIFGNNVEVTATCPFVSASGSVLLKNVAVVCKSGIHAIEVVAEEAQVAAENIRLRHTTAYFRSRAAVAILGMAGKNGRNDQIDVSGSVLQNITADGNAAAVVLGHAVGSGRVSNCGLTVLQPIRPSEIHIVGGPHINVSALTNVFGQVRVDSGALALRLLTSDARRTKWRFMKARKMKGTPFGFAT